jgi:hypothetical protein
MKIRIHISRETIRFECAVQVALRDAMSLAGIKRVTMINDEIRLQCGNGFFFVRDVQRIYVYVIN